MLPKESRLPMTDNTSDNTPAPSASHVDLLECQESALKDIKILTGHRIHAALCAPSRDQACPPEISAASHLRLGVDVAERLRVQHRHECG